MYTIIYIYRIKKVHEQTFLDITEKASEIYLANGALEDTIYLADALHGQHGCTGLMSIIDVAEDEAVYLGQSVFRNKSHYEDVMKQVNQDEEISRLYDEMTKIIDFTRVISATFTTGDRK
ncbi:hypothetical protein GCM10011409_30040 [Lentibacillus populi]|uniref:Uncharacterized protein n=1 Tax=Lentibacillus populi TaxID=1827502 RepID=A0A9W5TZ87_9BACI|nr:DUF1428 family protein [Lentibacillus populi]GGB50447.1 hypothetical protein GCM10011409_30040 [Lentibacillus populi]